MNIDLLAFDLDGTTLTSTKEISRVNREAFRKAHEAGIKLVPCTGRSLINISDALSDLLNELGFGAFPYIITDNGAQAYSLPVKKLLRTKNIPEKTALAVLEAGRSYSAVVYCSFGLEGATDNKGKVWENGVGQGMIAGYQEKWYIPLADVEPLIRWNCGSVKFSLVFFYEEEFRRGVEEFSKWPDLSLASGDTNSLEIMSAGINKGETLRFVSEHSGIPMERIMAIGDNYNDLDMISAAGFGVAMGNAVPALKEKARWITASNDKDGVALAIEKILQNGTEGIFL
ncbi:MAG: Cof-type HAD-IIB family hydrolase [Treponema sp.]|jgi:Cof subfamily protein (haloacid dehalogenase superfamily)|nr:Cof-type HAD-IIB family hydrolase [Treponema sp.]